MTRFVPGPYEVALKHGLPVVLSPNGQIAAMTVAGGIGRALGDLSLRVEVVSTASLFAAAPDLYAALEALQKRIVESDLWHGQEDELSAASAALAKARGEQ